MQGWRFTLAMVEDAYKIEQLLHDLSTVGLFGTMRYENGWVISEEGMEFFAPHFINWDEMVRASYGPFSNRHAFKCAECGRTTDNTSGWFACTGCDEYLCCHEHAKAHEPTCEKAKHKREAGKKWKGFAHYRETLYACKGCGGIVDSTKQSVCPTCQGLFCPGCMKKHRPIHEALRRCASCQKERPALMPCLGCGMMLCAQCHAFHRAMHQAYADGPQERAKADGTLPPNVTGAFRRLGLMTDGPFTRQQIEDAYKAKKKPLRAKIKRYHPDVNPSEEAATETKHLNEQIDEIDNAKRIIMDWIGQPV